MEDPIFHATDAETDSNFPEKKTESSSQIGPGQQ
jgi:hypothetical protein